METAALSADRKAPSSYPTILGEAMETSASFEARSAPLPYPTGNMRGGVKYEEVGLVLPCFLLWAVGSIVHRFQVKTARMRAEATVEAQAVRGSRAGGAAGSHWVAPWPSRDTRAG